MGQISRIALVVLCVAVLLSIDIVLAAKKKTSSPAQSSRAVSSLGVGPASQHSCVVLANGLGIKCFGPNLDGQLGQLTTTTQGDAGFVEMGDCLRTSVIGTNAGPTQVVMGDTFTCALIDEGYVRCFGNCASGICGNGLTTGAIGDSQNDSPLNFQALTLPSPGIQLSAGASHVCVVSDDETARCFGTNSDGQLGLGYASSDVISVPPTTPIDFGYSRKVRQISAGYTHTCAVLESLSHPNQTELVCFGSCVFGKCGSGDAEDNVDVGNSLDAVELGKDADGRPRWALQVSAGAAHTCVSCNSQSYTKQYQQLTNWFTGCA